MRLKDIKYTSGKYWVKQIKEGYEIYREGLCCSTRCGQIGFTGQIGLNKAIRWIETHFHK